MKRITEIDGLRAIAVLGVLWSHCWMFSGNLSFDIIGLPINRILSFGGVGVDLFFVISGFCMYYIFERKYTSINIYTFLNFIKNRWLRIAPVFYFAVVIYSLSNYFKGVKIDINTIVYHFLFVHTLFDKNNIATHFWSLATEFHFYLSLPLLFFIGRKKFGIYRTLYILMILCLFCRFIQWGYLLESPLSIENYDRFYLRFIEFAWGIIICKIYIDNKKIPKLCLGNLGFLIAFVIAFLGRLMNTSELILAFKGYGFILRGLSEPVMSFGFALIILNVIKSKSIVTKILNSLPFQSIGKVSYSFYLWHWMVSSYLSNLIGKQLGYNNFTLNLAFAFSIIITYFVSFLSYKLIEEPYFVKQKLENSKLKLV